MQPPPLPDSPVAAPWRRDLLLLTVIFGLMLGFHLGRAPLANPDEGRYAEIPREMIAAGEWVTPQLNDVVYFEKPPLMFWMVAVCQKTFGPGELSLRLTPAVFALAGVLLTYAFGRKVYGRNTGVLAAGVLGTSLLYFGTGRFLVLDMPVTVLMTATLVCFLCGVYQPPGWQRRMLFYGLYASAALATLTKGFIGFLVTGAVMFLWLVICRQWHRLRPLYLPSGIALFLAVALPWHVLAALRNEGWAHRYIVFEHWERFTTTQHGRSQPWHFFIWVLLAGIFPWSMFLFRGLREGLRGGWERRSENARGWFLIIWIGFIVLFFSSSGSKMASYILPVFPAVAVLIGIALERALRERTAQLRGEFIGYAALCGLIAVGLVVAVYKPGVIRYAGQAAALRPVAIALAALLLASAAVAPLLAAKRGVRHGLALIGATAVLFLLLLMTAAPALQRPGTKVLALQVKAQAGPDDRVVHYREFFHDFTYYTGRFVDVVSTQSELELDEDAGARASGRFYGDDELRRRWTGPQRFWLITRQRDLKHLTADPGFRYEVLGRTPEHYLLSNRP